MVTVRQLMMQLSQLPPDANVFILSPDEENRDYEVEFVKVDDKTVRVW